METPPPSQPRVWQFSPARAWPLGTAHHGSPLWRLYAQDGTRCLLEKILGVVVADWESEVLSRSAC